MNPFLQFGFAALIGLTTGLEAADSLEPPARLGSWREELEALREDPAFRCSQWGIAIARTETGEPLLQFNADKGFIPASNRKLLITAAALLALGREFRPETRLYFSGSLTDNGHLRGDLILKGGGDPCLSGHDLFDSETGLAAAVKAHGIKRVSGRIIGDDNYFTDEELGLGWEWNDINECYAARISALSYEHNCVTLCFTPGGDAGELPRIDLDPETGCVSIINRVTTVNGGETRITIRPASGGYLCQGRIKKESAEYRIAVPVANPTLYAVDALERALRSSGIDTDVEIADIDDTVTSADTLSLLARHTGPRLIELVRMINSESLNLHAEMLLRLLGAELLGRGEASAGLQVEDDMLQVLGLRSDERHLVDGSGLSRLNWHTPGSMADLLCALQHHPLGPCFRSSLPQAGRDGTLRNRLETIAVRAKSGTLSGINALSGYLNTRGHGEWAFSIYLNFHNASARAGEAAVDRLCERIEQLFEPGR